MHCTYYDSMMIENHDVWQYVHGSQIILYSSTVLVEL